MPRRTRTFAVFTTALAIVAATMAPAQAAAPSPVSERLAPRDVSLQWTGEAGFLTIEAAVLGTVTVVPGGSGETTLRVRNDGPSAGTLTASIVGAEFRGADHGDEFFRDLRINDMDAADLAHGDHVFHTVDLARGAIAEVPLRYELPLAATSGNRAQVGERTLTFDVQLHITGDTLDAPGANAVPAPPGATDRTQPAEAADDDGWSGTTAVTGGAALTPRTWMLALAAGLVAIALAAARARRRAPVSREET